MPLLFLFIDLGSCLDIQYSLQDLGINTDTYIAALSWPSPPYRLHDQRQLRHPEQIGVPLQLSDRRAHPCSNEKKLASSWTQTSRMQYPIVSAMSISADTQVHQWAKKACKRKVRRRKHQTRRRSQDVEFNKDSEMVNCLNHLLLIKAMRIGAINHLRRVKVTIFERRKKL